MLLPWNDTIRPRIESTPVIRTRTAPRRARWAMIAGFSILTAMLALLFGHLADSATAPAASSASVASIAQDHETVAVPDEPSSTSGNSAALLVAGCAALCLALGIGCLLAVLALLRAGGIRLLPSPAPPRPESAPHSTVTPLVPTLALLGISRI
ncbi:hypothetical protein [Herbiconiux sp. A18JL235]|uniref:Uncharacterized protein n=1 Tax=Herbiconiux sp. A18JL235 TaxID=3152363 RepID=A0AB39BN06_9MICO